MNPSLLLLVLSCWLLAGGVDAQHFRADYQLYCNTTSCAARAVFISPNQRKLFVLTPVAVYRFDTPVTSSFPSDPPPPSVRGISFFNAKSLWVDRNGTLWVSDSENNRVLWFLTLNLNLKAESLLMEFWANTDLDLLAREEEKRD